MGMVSVLHAENFPAKTDCARKMSKNLALAMHGFLARFLQILLFTCKKSGRRMSVFLHGSCNILLFLHGSFSWED